MSNQREGGLQKNQVNGLLNIGTRRSFTNYAFNLKTHERTINEFAIPEL